MKDHAQKQNQPQQRASPDIKRPRAKPPAVSPTVDSILRLQRTIGNQAVLRLLRANAEGPELRSAASATTHSAHPFGRMPGHSKAPVRLQAKRAVNTPEDADEQEADAVSGQVMRASAPQLQRACACGGGGECSECGKKRSSVLQTKLTINEPGDIYEQEADRVADQVTGTPALSAVSDAPPRIQRLSGQAHGRADAAPASVDQALASPGRPLEPGLQQDMEQRFGHDFSRVRVHSDATAEQSARDVSADAYTVGHNVVFGRGRFSPGTHEGRRLIAHELTHVVQQSGAAARRGGQAQASPALQRSPAGKSPAEAGDPVEEEKFPQYGWHRVGGGSFSGTKPGVAVIKAIVGEGGGIDRELLAETTGSFVYRKAAEGGPILPPYYAFRHPKKGVVARAFAEREGIHPEWAKKDPKFDPKLWLKQSFSYNVYVFSPHPAKDAEHYSPHLPLSTAPPIPSDDKRERKPEAEETSVIETGVDIATDLIPVVSNFKDAAIALTGVNPVTGEKVGIPGRIASAIFAIPGLGNLLKYIGKGAKGLWTAIKWIRKSIALQRARKKVAALKLVIHLSGTGLTQKLLKEFGKEGLEKLAQTLGPELTAKLAQDLGPAALKQAVDKYGAQGLKNMAERLGPNELKNALSKEAGKGTLDKTAREAEDEAARRGKKKDKKARKDMNCHEHMVACLLTSLADEPGSVYGQSRCLFCAEVCKREGGIWPDTAPTTRKPVRCDYWNFPSTE